VVTIKQSQKASLGTSRTLHTSEAKIVPNSPHVPQVPQQFLNPKSRAFSNSGQLCRLEVCETKSWKSAMFRCKDWETRNENTQRAYKISEAGAEENKVGIAIEDHVRS